MNNTRNNEAMIATQCHFLQFSVYWGERGKRALGKYTE